MEFRRVGGGASEKRRDKVENTPGIHQKVHILFSMLIGTQIESGGSACMVTGFSENIDTQ